MITLRAKVGICILPFSLMGRIGGGDVPLDTFDNIEQILYYSVINDPNNAVMQLLKSAKLYLHEIPQKKTLPAIVYQNIATELHHTSENTIGLRTKTFQFTCWAATKAEAIVLCDVLKDILNATKGIYGDIKVERCNPIDERDALVETTNDDELRRKGVQVDYAITYQRI